MITAPAWIYVKKKEMRKIVIIQNKTTRIFSQHNFSYSMLEILSEEDREAVSNFQLFCVHILDNPAHRHVCVIQ